MNHLTYLRAADKMEYLGQIKTANRVREHAKDMAHRVINEMSFDVLVGEVRDFPGAKFDSVRLDKHPGDEYLSPDKAWVLHVIMKSGDHTHSIISSINNTGDIRWSEGNKFMNRKTVNQFSRLIKILCLFEESFDRYLTTTKLNPDNLSVISRTFYIKQKIGSRYIYI